MVKLSFAQRASCTITRTITVRLMPYRNRYHYKPVAMTDILSRGRASAARWITTCSSICPRRLLHLCETPLFYVDVRRRNWAMGRNRIPNTTRVTIVIIYIRRKKTCGCIDKVDQWRHNSSRSFWSGITETNTYRLLKTMYNVLVSIILNREDSLQLRRCSPTLFTYNFSPCKHKWTCLRLHPNERFGKCKNNQGHITLPQCQGSMNLLYFV